MAKKKISQLTDASDLDGSELVPVVQGGITKKTTSNKFVIKKEDKVSGVIANGTDNYTADVPDVTALVDGLKILVTFENPNTADSTLNLNSLGALPIAKNYDDVLSPGDLKGSMWLMYNATNWVVVGSVGSSSGGGSSKKIQEFHTLGNRYTNLAADIWFASSVESGLVTDNIVNIGINYESVGIASAGATVWITPLAIVRQSSKLKKLFFRSVNNSVTSIRLVVFIGQSVNNSNTRINISTIHDETFSLATVDTGRASFKEISSFTNDVTIPAGYDLCYMFVNKSGAGSKYINGMQISGYLEEI